MNFDFHVLSAVATVSSLLLAMGLWVSQRVIADDPSLRLWARAALSNAMAYVLLSFYGTLPDLIAIGLANVLLLVGGILVYVGCCTYRGWPPLTRPLWVLTALVAVVMIFLSDLTPDARTRVLVISAVSALVTGLTTVVMLRPGEAFDRVARWVVALPFLGMTLVLIVRVYLMLTAPDSVIFIGARNHPLGLGLLLTGIALNFVLALGLPLLVAGKFQRDFKINEERYRTLYRRTPGLLHSIDVHGRLVSVSDHWLTTFGYNRDEVVGRPFTDFMSAASRTALTGQGSTDFLGLGACIDAPVQLSTREGRVLDLRLSSIVQMDAHGQGLQSLAVMTDVSERLRAVAALAESESRFRGAFEFAAQGMAIVSPQGRYLLVNAMLEDMLGYSAAELLSRDFQSLTHPDDLEADLAHVDDLIQGRADAYHMEKRYFHKSGRILWATLSVSVVRDATGKPLHTVSQIQDITQLKNARERIAALLDSATDGMHILDDTGRLVQFSASFARLLGYTDKEAAALSVFDWDVSLRRDYIRSQLSTTSETPRTFETRYRRKDGTELEVEVSAKGLVLDGQRYTYASARDLTHRKDSQRRLRRMYTEQKAMLDNDLIGIVKVQGRHILWANPAFERTLGYASGQLVGSSVEALYPSREAYKSLVREAGPVLAEGQLFRKQVLNVCKDSTPIWVEISGSMLDPKSGETLWGLVDVTKRHIQEQQLHHVRQRMELALAGADLGLWDLDLRTGQIIHNPRLFAMLGYGEDELEVSQEKFDSFVHPDDLARWRESFWRVMTLKAPQLNVELRLRHKDGHWVWVLTRGRVVETDPQGRSLRMAGTNLDITERKDNEARIVQLAFYDPLTDLPNRRLLFDRLNHALPASGRHNSYGAVLFLDLDNFKALNDSRGHASGDLLLQEVARRLLACVRVEDTVARPGGDEFVVMLERLDAQSRLAEREAEAIAEKICASVAEPFTFPEFNHSCTCSIGIAMFKGVEQSPSDIVKQADMAMYQAKFAGRNTVRLVSEVVDSAWVSDSNPMPLED